jgi:hypothetical protein
MESAFVTETCDEALITGEPVVVVAELGDFAHRVIE